MPFAFSIYLDIVRFAAALIVFIGHASGTKWTGGFLWQAGAYADTCVVVFFVLSGFVIGYVTETKENTWKPYAASRISRIWSVAIPALVLTFVVDLFGVQIAPELYINQPWYAGDMALLRYIMSFFMLHEAWHLKLVPGINAPFWSLSFEAFFYLAFAIFFYSKTWKKWLIVALVMTAAGPLIASLFPIWLLGYLAYRQTRKIETVKALNYAYFIIGSACILLSPVIRSFDQTGFKILGEPVIGRYIDGFGFYFNLIGIYGISKSMPEIKTKVLSAIPKIASITFPLYLFHRPLIQFFSYVGPDNPSSIFRRFLVIAGTLFIVLLLSPYCEMLRNNFRRRISNLLTSESSYFAKSPT